MTLTIILPAIWLIILIVGLPQLSETVYTPSLPAIAHSLVTTESMVENTLTIYLIAFAIGTLFWGRLSDEYGRKPCVLLGLVIFGIGCVICYFSTSIYMLLVGRFIQAFGGSIGSVLGQAICRDAFHGPDLGKVFSLVGSALAVFPAVGPVVGGFIAQHYGWQSIFLWLIIVTIGLIALVAFLLTETLHKENPVNISMQQVAFLLMRDKKVIALGLIVAICNGIMFSYFAEGSFYLISLLGLLPTNYGLTFIIIALGTLMGGLFSKYLHTFFNGMLIMRYGLRIIFGGASALSFVVLCFGLVIPKNVMIIMTIFSQMIISFGICMATTNALSIALIDYKWCIGTASALFGFYYYCLISLCTFMMAWLHNGTLYIMPLYFLVLAFSMLFIEKCFLRENVL